MRNVTINYAKESWLMGIDPDATGRQLKKLRCDRGITQERLSDLFGRCGDSASRVVISMWENGKKLPSLSHMVLLSELYGCSLDELVVSYRRSREIGDDNQLVPFFIEYLNLLTSICLCRCSSFLFNRWFMGVFRKIRYNRGILYERRIQMGHNNVDNYPYHCIQLPDHVQPESKACQDAFLQHIHTGRSD